MSYKKAAKNRIMNSTSLKSAKLARFKKRKIIIFIFQSDRIFNFEGFIIAKDYFSLLNINFSGRCRDYPCCQVAVNIIAVTDKIAVVSNMLERSKSWVNSIALSDFPCSQPKPPICGVYHIVIKEPVNWPFTFWKKKVDPCLGCFMAEMVV